MSAVFRVKLSLLLNNRVWHLQNAFAFADTNTQKLKKCPALEINLLSIRQMLDNLIIYKLIYMIGLGITYLRHLLNVDNFSPLIVRDDKI